MKTAAFSTLRLVKNTQSSTANGLTQPHESELRRAHSANSTAYRLYTTAQQAKEPSPAKVDVIDSYTGDREKRIRSEERGGALTSSKLASVRHQDSSSSAFGQRH